MEYQDIISIWNSSDKELENIVKINKVLLKETSMKKIKSQLYEIKWSSIIEIFVNSIFLIFLVGFIVSHFMAIEYSIPAGILTVITVFSLVYSGYKLSLFNKIDSGYSVLETQRTMERLKYYERFDKNILLLIIPLFSPVFLIVMAKVLFDFNLYSLGNWLILYTLGSVIIAVVVVFMLKKFPNKNLQKSISFLQEIDEIEKNE